MIAWTEFAPGDHRTTCPQCGRGERDKSLGLTVEHDGRGVAHCFRCQYVETWQDNRPATHRPAQASRCKAQSSEKRTTLSDYGHELWAQSTVVGGTLGAKYLAARHCPLPPEDGDLRFHPALKHPSGYVGPALLARVTDAASGIALTLHRTWIQADGRKADVDPPRLLLGGHRKEGGVIRLWPDESVTYGLGVAEGIETALSLAHAFTPVWACIDAGNLGKLPLLRGIECLLVGADRDAAGERGAAECAARWASAGVEVRITTQPQNDLNDVLKEAVQ